MVVKLSQTQVSNSVSLKKRQVVFSYMTIYNLDVVFDKKNTKSMSLKMQLVEHLLSFSFHFTYSLVITQLY